METWKLLLITFLSAVVLGWIAGVIIGKIQVKLMRRKRGPLLSRKELLVMAAVFLIGIGCVLFGVLRQNGGGEEITPLPGDGMENPGMAGEDAVPADGGEIMLFDDAEAAEGETKDGDEAVDGEESSEEEQTLGTSVKESGNTGTAVVATDRGVAVAIARPR